MGGNKFSDIINAYITAVSGFIMYQPDVFIGSCWNTGSDAPIDFYMKAIILQWIVIEWIVFILSFNRIVADMADLADDHIFIHIHKPIQG